MNDLEQAPESSPRLIIIGGPNGAGKTTFAREFLPHEGGCRRFLNAEKSRMGFRRWILLWL
jgi:predicted ABC-type ATPase